MIAAATREKLLAGALIGCAALAAHQWGEATKLRAEMAGVKQEHSEYRERAQADANAALQALRTDELRARRIQQEAIDAEHERRTAAEAALRRADAAGRGLRDELEATRSYLAALDTESAQGCRAAAETAAMCTGLLGQCSERRRELAGFAEAAAGAGAICQRSYEALTPAHQAGELTP